VWVNFAGIFLGLLLLGTGAAGFLLSARVNELAPASGDGALGFEVGTGSVLPLATDESTTYVAVATDPPTGLHRLLSLLWLAVLVGAISAVSAWIVWEIGSAIVNAFLSQFAGD
jgi:hypothetical protein